MDPVLLTFFLSKHKKPAIILTPHFSYLIINCKKLKGEQRRYSEDTEDTTEDTLLLSLKHYKTFSIFKHFTSETIFPSKWFSCPYYTLSLHKMPGVCWFLFCLIELFLKLIIIKCLITLPGPLDKIRKVV